MIRWAGRSPITHVAIGDRFAVLEHTAESTRWWPTDTYARGYPGLRWIVRLAVPREISLGDLDGTPPKCHWRIALWILGGGLFPCRTGCVAISVQTLRRAGVNVPKRITTPRQLLEWCLANRLEAAAV